MSGIRGSTSIADPAAMTPLASSDDDGEANVDEALGVDAVGVVVVELVVAGLDGEAAAALKKFMMSLVGLVGLARFLSGVLRTEASGADDGVEGSSGVQWWRVAATTGAAEGVAGWAAAPPAAAMVGVMVVVAPVRLGRMRFLRGVTESACLLVARICAHSSSIP